MPGAFASQMLSLAIAGGVLWAGASALAWLAADRLIFLPPPPSYRAEALGATLIDSGDGARIALLHLPHPTARYTLLYSHGNAEDLGHIAPVLALLHDAGFAVLAYDYRGYGASRGGPPSVAGAYRDQDAAYRHATRTLGIAPDRLIVHGRSVGAGPAVALAAREPVAGLILESAFVSAYRVLTRVPLLPFDRFDNLARLPAVRCPVLVIHGRRDRIVPVWHGERLHAAVRGPRQAYWVEDAGHNDLVSVAGAGYTQQLQAFAVQLARRDLPPP